MDKLASNSKGTILIAEDDPVLSRILRGVLEHHSYKVVVAKTGHIALETFMRQPFDLVIMDYNLPGLDGMEVTKAIRAFENSKAPPTPIIAHTSDTRLTTLKNCLKSGMNDYLMKPANQKDLMGVVGRWVVVRA